MENLLNREAFRVTYRAAQIQVKLNFFYKCYAKSGHSDAPQEGTEVASNSDASTWITVALPAFLGKGLHSV